jgi:hypothetical protein
LDQIHEKVISLATAKTLPFGLAAAACAQAKTTAKASLIQTEFSAARFQENLSPVQFSRWQFGDSLFNRTSIRDAKQRPKRNEPGPLCQSQVGTLTCAFYKADARIATIYLAASITTAKHRMRLIIREPNRLI